AKTAIVPNIQFVRPGGANDVQDGMDEWSSTTQSPPRRGGEWTLHMERTLEASMPMAARNQDPDVELIERYFAGDTSAFDEIMIRYERQIYRVCYRFWSIVRTQWIWHRTSSSRHSSICQ